MGAGDTYFGDHERNIANVPKLLQSVQKQLDNRSIHPVLLSARFHQYFIYLHPFHDGNGRIGRLLSNVILAKNNHPLIIIPLEEKQDYIDALKASKKHREFVPIESFFLRTATNRMENELSEKKNLFRNFLLKPIDEKPAQSAIFRHKR
jgi:Fic family protein